MKRPFTHYLHVCILIAIGTGMLSGCAKIPFTHYYTFHPDLVGKLSASASPVPVVLAIGTFEADIPYKQDRIVFRTSPYEVGFYEYHKWLRPLTELVLDKIVRQGKASGFFARVHGQAFQVAADYILVGTITMFDRWNSAPPSDNTPSPDVLSGDTSSEDAASSLVRIQITYQLLDAYGEQIVWMDTIDSTAVVSELETVVTTVRSFEAALHVNIQQALDTVHDVVSRQP